MKMMKAKTEIPSYKMAAAVLIMVGMCVLPWITRLKILHYDDTTAQYFQNVNGAAADFFLYYKSVFVVILAALILCMVIGENIFPDDIIQDTPLRSRAHIKMLICVLVYIVMTAASAFFSDYPATVKTGSPSECESVWTLTGYMLLFVGGMNYFCYENVSSLLKKILLGLAFVTIALNCVEFFYKPLFDIPWIKLLLSTTEYREVVNSISTAGFTNMVALTFYNPNYYGGFGLLLFPFMLEFYINAGATAEKITECIAAAGMFFCVLCAKSTASFYLVFVEIGLVLFLNRKSIKKRWIRLVVLAAVTAGFLMCVNFLTNGKIYAVSSAAATNDSQSTETLSQEGIFKLTDIQIQESTLILSGEEHKLIIKVNGTELSFFDENGVELPAYEEDGKLCLQDEGFSMIDLYMNANSQLVLDLGYPDTIEFYVSDGSFYGVGQNGAKITQVSRNPRFGTGVYGYFTGRGYAWINTLPLLKNTVVLGHGAGTFPFYFQQNDYVGLINTHGSIKFVIDKPHNMYLQNAVDNGCIAAAAIVVLFGLVIWNFIKNEKKMSQDNSDGIRTDNLKMTAKASITAAAAFMIYAAANDSMVAVNPLFWIVLGINVSAVYGVKQAAA